MDAISLTNKLYNSLIDLPWNIVGLKFNSMQKKTNLIKDASFINIDSHAKILKEKTKLLDIPINDHVYTKHPINKKFGKLINVNVIIFKGVYTINNHVIYDYTSNNTNYFMLYILYNNLFVYNCGIETK